MSAGGLAAGDAAQGVAQSGLAGVGDAGGRPPGEAMGAGPSTKTLD